MICFSYKKNFLDFLLFLIVEFMCILFLKVSVVTFGIRALVWA